MDEHFRTAPLEQNLPVIAGLIGVWYRNFFGAQTLAILPYDQYLHRFAAYFQQGDMESNGKSVDAATASASTTPTGPVIWGEPGTNGQHAFYQLHPPGHEADPVRLPRAGRDAQTRSASTTPMLLANFFAQTEALMRGKTEDEVRAELKAQGLTGDGAREAACRTRCSRATGRPTSILYQKLDPRTLGTLIALYEHKIFVQGVIWNINSFDQWGVELGKQLAKAILPELEGNGAGHEPRRVHQRADQSLQATARCVGCGTACRRGTGVGSADRRNPAAHNCSLHNDVGSGEDSETCRGTMASRPGPTQSASGAS